MVTNRKKPAGAVTGSKKFGISDLNFGYDGSGVVSGPAVATGFSADLPLGSGKPGTLAGARRESKGQRMLGRSHALSGAVAGLAIGSFVLHEPAGQLVLLGGLTAAFALAPDIDQCGSTSARSLGFVTEALAWVIRTISGGHRHATHSLVGIGTFTAVAWLACLFRHTWPGRVVLALVLAAGIAAAADALRPGPAHGENVAGLVAAIAMCWTGYGLALVPIPRRQAPELILPGTC